MGASGSSERYIGVEAVKIEGKEIFSIIHVDSIPRGQLTFYLCYEPLTEVKENQSLAR